MYVCLCNAYRESQVRDAIQNSPSGAVTAEELYAHLGRSPRCGRCLIYVNEMIQATRAEQMVPDDVWAGAEVAVGS